MSDPYRATNRLMDEMVERLQGADTTPSELPPCPDCADLRARAEAAEREVARLHEALGRLIAFVQHPAYDAGRAVGEAQAVYDGIDLPADRDRHAERAERLEKALERLEEPTRKWAGVRATCGVCGASAVRPEGVVAVAIPHRPTCPFAGLGERADA